MTEPDSAAPAAAPLAQPLRLDQALTLARARGLDRVDALALLGHLLQQPRAWLIAHDDHPLDALQAQTFAAWCQRRQAGEPVAYLLGRQEFHGLLLQVTPEVLIPRPDTETLVDWALALLAGPLAQRAAPRVLDLGTGSGAIALALRHRCPAAQVTAVDLSPAALAVARANGDRLGLPVQWCEGRWWQAVAGQSFDLVVSNPPYIAEGDPHLAGLGHEPRLALTPGGDGLAAYREILAGAAGPLVSGGWLLFEHGYDQAAAVQALMAQAGFQSVQQRLDLGGQVRCSGGQRV